MRTNILLATLACGVVCYAASPVFDIKPGLWEMTTTTQVRGMPPIPNLDQMPAAQRARIEAMMKSMAGAPRTSTHQNCVTRDAIEKAIARASSNKNEKCDPKVISMTASKVVMHIDCQAEQGAKTTGDMTIERADSEHMTGNGLIKSAGNGHSMDIKWSLSGKFVASSCGNVKPEGQ